MPLKSFRGLRKLTIRHAPHTLQLHGVPLVPGQRPRRYFFNLAAVCRDLENLWRIEVHAILRISAVYRAAAYKTTNYNLCIQDSLDCSKILGWAYSFRDRPVGVSIFITGTLERVDGPRRIE